MNETVDTVNNEAVFKQEAGHQFKECAKENKETPSSGRTSMTSAVGRGKGSLEEQLGNLARLSAELANLNQVVEELRNLTAAAEEKTRKQLEVSH